MDDDPKYPLEALPKLMTFRLARLQARVNAQAARILNKYVDISLSEWRIFVMIDTHGKITPAQIVRLTKFDKGLISRTIKRMHEKELVWFETNESDQRSHQIDFTPEGRAVFEQARPAMRKRQEMFRKTLGSDELEILFRAFDKLDIALDEMEKKL